LKGDVAISFIGIEIASPPGVIGMVSQRLFGRFDLKRRHEDVFRRKSSPGDRSPAGTG
jgi:hypothetical protein